MKAQLVYRFMTPPVKLLLKSPLHGVVSSKRTEDSGWRDTSAGTQESSPPDIWGYFWRYR